MASKKSRPRRIKKPSVSSSPAVLFRPERKVYVRGERRAGGCVFCQALKRGPSAESLLLHVTAHAMIIMNKYPYNSGHLLVLPRRHSGDFLQITSEEHVDISRCQTLAVCALSDAYQPAGFNMGLNLGAASGAGIPEHLHFHVIPRWAGDTNFFPLIARSKVVIETLEQTYEKLRAYFTKADAKARKGARK